MKTRMTLKNLNCENCPVTTGKLGRGKWVWAEIAEPVLKTVELSKEEWTKGLDARQKPQSAENAGKGA